MSLLNKSDNLHNNLINFSYSNNSNNFNLKLKVAKRNYNANNKSCNLNLLKIFLDDCSYTLSNYNIINISKLELCNYNKIRFYLLYSFDIKGDIDLIDSIYFIKSKHEIIKFPDNSWEAYFYNYFKTNNKNNTKNSVVNKNFSEINYKSLKLEFSIKSDSIVEVENHINIKVINEDLLIKFYEIIYQLIISNDELKNSIKIFLLENKLLYNIKNDNYLKNNFFEIIIRIILKKFIIEISNSKNKLLNIESVLNPNSFTYKSNIVPYETFINFNKEKNYFNSNINYSINKKYKYTNKYYNNNNNSIKIINHANNLNYYDYDVNLLNSILITSIHSKNKQL